MPSMNAPIVGYLSETVLTVAIIIPPIIALIMNSILLLIDQSELCPTYNDIALST